MGALAVLNFAVAVDLTAIQKQEADAQAHLEAAGSDAERKVWQNRLDVLHQLEASIKSMPHPTMAAPVQPVLPPPVGTPGLQVPPMPKAIVRTSPDVARPAARQTPPEIPPPPGKDFASRKPLQEIRAPTMVAIGDLLAPSIHEAPSNPEAARAFAILKRHELAHGAVPVPATPGLAGKLGQAMMLGSRTSEFLPELAKLSDALPRGNKAAREAALDLWKKMGRTPPGDKLLGKMLADASGALSDFLPPPQHGSIADAGGSDIQVDASPPGGTSRVSVILPDGPGGAPERVTFGGHAQTSVDGSDLKTSLAPDEPRVVTKAAAQKQRETVNGVWTDQEGKKWEISGTGDNVVFVSTSDSGHQMKYAGQWSLGLPFATHIVNDIEDIADDLPGDVRADLAANWHPPFAIRLEYRASDNRFEGTWISGVVTYSGLAHMIKMVEDPTWDKPLVLTRSKRITMTFDFFAGAGVLDTPEVQP